MVIIQYTLQIQTSVEQPITKVPQVVDDIPVNEIVLEIPKIIEQLVEHHDPQENDDSTLKRSTRERKSAILSDYIVYL